MNVIAKSSFAILMNDGSLAQFTKDKKYNCLDIRKDIYIIKDDSNCGVKFESKKELLDNFKVDK